MKHVKLFEQFIAEKKAEDYIAYIDDKRSPGGTDKEIMNDYSLQVLNRTKSGFDIKGALEDIEAFIEEYGIILDEEPSAVNEEASTKSTDINAELGMKPNSGLAKELLDAATKTFDDKYQESYTVELKGKTVSFSTSIALHALAGIATYGSNGKREFNKDGAFVIMQPSSNYMEVVFDKGDKRKSGGNVKMNFDGAKLSNIMKTFSKLAAQPDPFLKGTKAATKQQKAEILSMIADLIGMAGAADFNRSKIASSIEDELYAKEAEIEDAKLTDLDYKAEMKELAAIKKKLEKDIPND
jgi:hypothetical protein